MKIIALIESVFLFDRFYQFRISANNRLADLQHVVLALGNNGNTIAWNNMFTGATGANNHNATVKSGICPAGYSAPTIVDYDNLISAYGGTPFSSGRRGYQESTGALYSMLGLSDYRSFWSSTENNSSYAYRLSGDSSFSDSSSYDNKGSNFYVLCYK